MNTERTINEQTVNIDERTQRALDELKGMILERYPEAQFEVVRGIDDPESVHLDTTVDIEDVDEVHDLVIDRLFEMQVDEGLNIHVIPLEPVERVLEQMQEEAAYVRSRGRVL